MQIFSLNLGSSFMLMTIYVVPWEEKNGNKEIVVGVHCVWRSIEKWSPSVSVTVPLGIITNGKIWNAVSKDYFWEKMTVMKLDCICALFLSSFLYDECIYSTRALILVLQGVCIHVEQNSE